MDTTTALLIAIPVLVVLAGVVLFASARRRDTGEAIGALARETRKRDRGVRRPCVEGDEADAGHRPRGGAGRRHRAARVRQGAGHRRRHRSGRVGAARSRGARRHPPPVHEPRHRHLLRPRAGRLRRLGARLPLAAAERRVRLRDQHRQHRRRRHQDRRGPGLRLLPRGPDVGHPLPRRGAGRRPRGVLTARAGGHGGGLHGALPEVRAPRLPRAPVPHLAVVRVPVPRLAVQPQRREEGRPGAAWPRPLPARRLERQRQREHRTIITGPARSAPTPPARRPRAPTASAAESTEPLRASLRFSLPPPPLARPGHHGEGNRRRHRRGHRASAWSRYILVNLRQGRPEVGAEIELAPNRKPYYDDEQLEGPRLNRALASGLVLIAITAVGLPLYWLNEPGRQSGAIENFDQTFVNRGARLFAPTEEGGYNCAGCHGSEGVGGQAPPYTLTDADGEFVATVTWRAPALNTVLLRFSRTSCARSSSTAGPARRCRRGAPRAADRSPPSRSTS